MIFLLIIILFPAQAFSAPFKDDPYALMDITKRMASSIQIEFHSDDDVSERCQKESKRRGFGGWPYKVYACAFWNEDGGRKCSIYLPKNTNMHQIGHETSHCLLGAYHP